MAKIVLGIGSSHSPALLMEPPAWLARGANDDINRLALYDHEGNPAKFADLAKAAGDKFTHQIEPSLMWQRHEANARAMDRVAEILHATDPDVVIVIGDDHKEVYQDDNMPSVSVYWGDKLPYRPTGIMKWKYADDLRADLWYPQEEREYPVDSQLARRLIEFLCDNNFDPATSKFYSAEMAMSHSFGYVFHRMMTKKVWPIIPISLNTYFPPNQVSPLRAYRLGQALAACVKSWPEDKRVVIMATGGLSHFVVDEEFDRTFLDLMAKGGAEGHAALSSKKLQSGNSEFRCWSALAGAVEGMNFNLIDYIPCYRSLAGTGCGMAFAHWD